MLISVWSSDVCSSALVASERRLCDEHAARAVNERGQRVFFATYRMAAANFQNAAHALECSQNGVGFVVSIDPNHARLIGAPRNVSSSQRPRLLGPALHVMDVRCRKMH